MKPSKTPRIKSTDRLPTSRIQLKRILSLFLATVPACKVQAPPPDPASDESFEEWLKPSTSAPTPHVEVLENPSPISTYKLEPEVQTCTDKDKGFISTRNLYDIRKANDNRVEFKIIGSKFDIDSTKSCVGPDSPVEFTKRRLEIQRIFLTDSLIHSLPFDFNHPEVRTIMEDNHLAFSPSEAWRGLYIGNIDGKNDLILLKNYFSDEDSIESRFPLNDLSAPSLSECNIYNESDTLCRQWVSSRSTLVHELIHDYYVEGMPTKKKNELVSILSEISLGENQDIEEWKKILKPLEEADKEAKEWEAAFKIAQRFHWPKLNTVDADHLRIALAWAFLVKKKIFFEYLEYYKKRYLRERIPEESTPNEFVKREIYAHLFNHQLLVPGLEDYFKPFLSRPNEFRPDVFNSKKLGWQWWEPIPEAELKDQANHGYIWASLKARKSFGSGWDKLHPDKQGKMWTIDRIDAFSGEKTVHPLLKEGDEWHIQRTMKKKRKVRYIGELAEKNPYISTPEGLKKLGKVLAKIYELKTSNNTLPAEYIIYDD